MQRQQQVGDVEAGRERVKGAGEVNGGGQLSPGAHAELAQGARDMILDGARGYPEPSRDLGIGKTAGDEICDLTLSGSEA